MTFAFRALAGWALLAAMPAAAQQPIDTPTVMETVERLKPGEFIWAPQIAPSGPLLMIVSLATQRAVVYRNGVPIAISTVSTGRPGYATPTGVFTVLEKDVEHYSSIYDNAPMPYMQRLTWGGVALHGGQLPGYPASHGCIRLPVEFARLLYDLTYLGMTVIVMDTRAVPRIAPSDPGSETGIERWHPDSASIGPVSIVVSGADRRMVVLRNGREIGSAPVSVRRRIAGTSAYVLRLDEGGVPLWFCVALPGQDVADLLVTGLDEYFEIAPGLRESIAQIVAPGTTLVLTADALGSDFRPRPDGVPPLDPD